MSRRTHRDRPTGPRRNRFGGRCCRCEEWVPQYAGTLTADNDILCPGHSPAGAPTAIGARAAEVVGARYAGPDRRARRRHARRKKPKQLGLFDGGDDGGR